MVIVPNTGYLWILARERQLPAEVRDRLIQQTEALGLDTRTLIWVDQSTPGG